MITRPIIATFTIWLTALFGWTGHQVTNAISEPKAQVTQSVQEVVYVDTKAPTILEQAFQMNEEGPRVKELQKAIGTVKVDGVYGSITRREHIEALQKRGLPTSNIPVITTQYNIPSDKAQRCPDLEPLFQAAGLEPVDVFSYIAFRESHCNPAAQNATWKNGVMTYHLNKDKSYDTGLLQINSSWKSVTEKVCGESASDNHMEGLKDPACNIAVAKYIMDNSQGKLGNWRVYKI